MDKTKAKSKRLTHHKASQGAPTGSTLLALVAKITQSRTALIDILGVDKFKELVEQIAPLIKQNAKANNKTIIESGVGLSVATIRNKSISLAMLAVTAELIAPTIQQ